MVFAVCRVRFVVCVTLRLSLLGIGINDQGVDDIVLIVIFVQLNCLDSSYVHVQRTEYVPAHT